MLIIFWLCSTATDISNAAYVPPSSNISAEFKSLFSVLNAVVDDSDLINDDNPEACLNSITCRYLECQDLTPCLKILFLISLLFT